jgi:hypothetical protein
MKEQALKQETLEEVAEKYYPAYPDGMVTSEIYALREGFIKGFKIKKDQDKNEAIEFAEWLEENAQNREYYPMKGMSMVELFEQFKKK